MLQPTLQPSLTNFADFMEQPKPVIPKTKLEIQSNINMYLNIIVLLIVIIGFIFLYLRFKYKAQHEEETKQKLQEFDKYLNEYYINDILQ